MKKLLIANLLVTRSFSGGPAGKKPPCSTKGPRFDPGLGRSQTQATKPVHHNYRAWPSSTDAHVPQQEKTAHRSERKPVHSNEDQRGHK